MKTPTPRKLPSGKWNIQVMVNGKRQSITAASERECMAQAMQLKAGYKLEVSPERITLGSALDDYISSHELLSPSTLRSYDSMRRNRFKKYINTPLRKINKDLAQKMVNEEAQIVSTKTLSNAWRFVSAALRDKGIELDVTLPKIERNERPFLDFEQIGVFLHAIDGKSYEMPAMLALMGLRRSEIYAMTWDNVNLEKKTITVAGAYVQSRNGFVLKKTNKTESSARTLPILIPQLYDKMMLVENKTGRIVTTGPDRLRENVMRVCKKAGIGDNIGCHSLRHSFASLCYHLKVPAHVCARWGGWKDLQTMQKIYTHLAEKDVEAEAENVQQFFQNL